MVRENGEGRDHLSGLPSVLAEGHDTAMRGHILRDGCTSVGPRASPRLRARPGFAKGQPEPARRMRSTDPTPNARGSP